MLTTQNKTVPTSFRGSAWLWSVGTPDSTVRRSRREEPLPNSDCCVQKRRVAYLLGSPAERGVSAIPHKLGMEKPTTSP